MGCSGGGLVIVLVGLGGSVGAVFYFIFFLLTLSFSFFV
jgi:hypothetical protein